VPRIRPFTGLLYDPRVAGRLDELTTPPYDVIGEGDRDRYYAASPYNVIRLIRGRHEPDDDAVTNRYTRAAAWLAEWRRRGALVATREPAVYPYEFRFRLEGGVRTVRGLIAAVDLEPFGGDVVPHERTMPEPERDRLSLLRAVRANLSPIHVVYPGPCARAQALIDGTTAGAPAAEVTDEADTRHRMWIRWDADAEAACRELSEQSLMIADGHHRYAVAAAYQREMTATVGPGPWDRMMMLLVDVASEDPPVLPIHRAVLPDPRAEDHIAREDRLGASGRRRVRDLAELQRSLRDDRLTVGMVRSEGGALRYEVVVLDGAPPTVRTLHQHVLSEVEHGDLAFVPDPRAAEEMVRSGSASTAFILPPTRVQTVQAVVTRGWMLPEKSTFFWPKPRTGMVIRPFDP
jgi:uncharacterized protein (DUF1015 family)